MAPSIIHRLRCWSGSHWPVAAFTPFHPGPQRSHCADCGAEMEKGDTFRWRAVRRQPNRAAQREANSLVLLTESWRAPGTALPPCTHPPVARCEAL
jgi:hypothetical protein